jgi:hypothetical protein
MVLQLASEKPEGGPWRAEPLRVVVEALVQLGLGRTAGGRGVVLAIDGRSSKLLIHGFRPRATCPASRTTLEYSNVVGCERLFPTATDS